jgi:hypothetical protein
MSNSGDGLYQFNDRDHLCRFQISDDGWDLMQDLARRSEIDNINKGWIAHTPSYKPLVWLKLIEERNRSGGGIEIKLTDFGWKMLIDGMERV